MDWYEVVQTMIEYMGLIPEGAYDDPEMALEAMKRRWDETDLMVIVEPDIDDCPDGYGDSIDAAEAEREQRHAYFQGVEDQQWRERTGRDPYTGEYLDDRW